jgi:outer membrane protein OmpA-like peptidoglycan-associated protein
MYSKVENLVFAKVGALFGKEKYWFLSFVSYMILTMYCLALCGCASSEVSRDVSSNIDQGVENTRKMVDNASSGTIADSYQNASQRAKGAILGGATGGLIGALSSNIGVLPGAAVGAILGASYGAYIDKNASVEDQLQNRGATIVVLGDQILIVLPSSRVFEYRSARIKSDAYSTLNLTARYINSYTKMLVKVSVYTDCAGPADLDLALSQEQADRVSKYLAAAGLDARVLYAMGYGGSHIVQRSHDWEASDNYRIEITLEKLYV